MNTFDTSRLNTLLHASALPRLRWPRATRAQAPREPAWLPSRKHPSPPQGLRPRGMCTESGLTVCILPCRKLDAAKVEHGRLFRAIAQRANALVARSKRARPRPRAPDQSHGDPCAMTQPPFAPDPLISTRWSAWRSTLTSWSTSTTEFPSARRSSSTTPKRPSTFEGCKPMDGSSRT